MKLEFFWGRILHLLEDEGVIIIRKSCRNLLSKCRLSRIGLVWVIFKGLIGDLGRFLPFV